MSRKSKLSPDRVAGSSYFSLEKGSCRKRWKNRTPVALVFPNSYELGMSNLGFQLVYNLLNRDDAIVAERFFLPRQGSRPFSIESNRPLGDFPFIFFSVSFEHDFQNLVLILELAGFSSLAEERSNKNLKVAAASAGGQPLVAAGGVATFMNPEPLAPFIDLFVIGEAEPLLPPVIAMLHKGLGENKIDLLKDLAAGHPGYYVPSFYMPEYGPDGKLLAFDRAPEYPFAPAKIRKVVLDTPGDLAAHSAILSPEAEFADMFVTELGRGCSRGCRFCAAGFIYRPPRLWKAESIINAVSTRPEGCSRIGLLGMEMARQEDIELLSDYLQNHACSLSFSSLRADIVSSSLTRLLGQSHLKSVAIAPDGGSERLRRVINKGITADDVLAAAETLAGQGIKNLKLYYMIGLPTETPADIEEMVDLTLRLKKILLEVGRARGKITLLTLSINCFIPKPWTPFQFHPMAEITDLKAKLQFLRKKLGTEPNLRIKAENPEKSCFQAALSRGDRRVGLALRRMILDNLKWRPAFKEEGIDPAVYVTRQRERDELFPWDIIDHGINRKYLWTEYTKALQAKTTPPCDTLRCKRCGVC